MPINPINFRRQETPDWSGLGDLFQNYWKGFEMARAPQRMELENQYVQSQIARNLREGQTSGFSGMAKNLASLHQLQNDPNADPQLVEAIQRQLQQEQEQAEQRSKYIQKTADTYMYRNAPASQKLAMNIDMLAKNKTYDMEGNTVDLTPQQALQRQNILGRELANLVTDQPTRQRLEAASNFAATLGRINPESAFRYSGGLGAVAEAYQKGKGALNQQQSAAYKQFEQNLTRLNIGAHQLSKFFDLSAAEAIQDEVNQLINPNYWMRNPEIAKAKYDALVDLFKTEHANMLSMQTVPGAYGVNLSPAGGTFAGQMYDSLMQQQNKPAHQYTNDEILEALTNG